MVMPASDIAAQFVSATRPAKQMRSAWRRIKVAEYWSDTCLDSQTLNPWLSFARLSRHQGCTLQTCKPFLRAQPLVLRPATAGDGLVSARGAAELRHEPRCEALMKLKIMAHATPFKGVQPLSPLAMICASPRLRLMPKTRWNEKKHNQERHFGIRERLRSPERPAGSAESVPT